MIERPHALGLKICCFESPIEVDFVPADWNKQLLSIKHKENAYLNIIHHTVLVTCLVVSVLGSDCSHPRRPRGIAFHLSKDQVAWIKLLFHHSSWGMLQI